MLEEVLVCNNQAFDVYFRLFLVVKGSVKKWKN